MAGQDSTPSSANWSLKVLVVLTLIFASVITLIFLLGLALWLGWTLAGGTLAGETLEAPADDSVDSVRYICPMLCTPPLEKPGRCPVCAMPLVPANPGEAGSAAPAVYACPMLCTPPLEKPGRCPVCAMPLVPVNSFQAGSAAPTFYVCPMLCTAPQEEPGRCPECAMELLPATFTTSP